MKQKIIVMLLTVALTLTSVLTLSHGASQEIPSFKVLWQDLSFILILVDKQTTTKQMTALIYEFRKAKKENYLSKWFPVTTPGLSDKYAGIYIYVFSEPKWASKEKMDKYFTLSRDQSFAKEYLKHVKALYHVELNDKTEIGTLGDTNGVVKSPFYKKLF